MCLLYYQQRGQSGDESNAACFGIGSPLPQAARVAVASQRISATGRCQCQMQKWKEKGQRSINRIFVVFQRFTRRAFVCSCIAATAWDGVENGGHIKHARWRIWEQFK